MSKYLTAEQISELLSVPLETVKYWIKVRRLPAVKPGRRPLVSEDDLATFLAAHPYGRPPVNEHARRAAAGIGSKQGRAVMAARRAAAGK